MVPDTTTMLASERGSGRSGPFAHLSKLPVPTVGATNTDDCAFCPSEPPMYRIFVPTWTAVPSVRGSGSDSSGGDWCHGMRAPTGAGHGNDSLSPGQKFTGDQTMTPRSTAGLTVR